MKPIGELMPEFEKKAAAAPKGRSMLRNVYSINRGYEDIVERLQSLGASIESHTG